MKTLSIAHLRREYRNRPLLEKNAPADPFVLFHRWFAEAVKAKTLDANAFTLSTLNPAQKPSSRIVLLKDLDRNGFTFFTNYESHKGQELQKHPFAGLLFFWPELARQVRVEGRVQKVSAAESDAYFKTRPRGSQLGAWASDQSRVLRSRKELEDRMQEFEEKYKGKTVPRPSHWGGYRVTPSLIEFWKGRPNRLHDRLLYRRIPSGRWKTERLAP